MDREGKGLCKGQSPGLCIREGKGRHISKERVSFPGQAATAEGAGEGSAEESSEGAAEGVAEGSEEGTSKGATEGAGSADGLGEGSED